MSIQQAPGGMPVSYYVLENADGFYYQGHSKPWTSHLHHASMLSEDLAERLRKRYPGSQIEREMAYSVEPLEHLEDVGEPQAIVALRQAVQLCARDGLSLPTILVQTEQAFGKVKK